MLNPLDLKTQAIDLCVALLDLAVERFVEGGGALSVVLVVLQCFDMLGHSPERLY